MTTRWVHPPDGCLFSALSFLEEITPKSQWNTKQHTLFAITNLYIVSLKPKINITSLASFLSLSLTPHIVLSMDISVLHKIVVSCSFRQHSSLPLIALHNSCKKSLSALVKIFNAATHHDHSHPPPAFTCQIDMHSLLLFPHHQKTYLPAPSPFQYSIHNFCKQNVMKTFWSTLSLQHIYSGSIYRKCQTKQS